MASTAEAKEFLEQHASVISAPAQRGTGPGKGQMVAFVKQHAAAYADAGWDIVTEATPDELIEKATSRARSLTGAVNGVRDRIVEPWVMQLVETRPGDDSDEQLKILERFRAEKALNIKDATARLLDSEVEIDLSNFEAPGGLQPVKPAADEPKIVPAAEAEGDEGTTETVEPEDGESSDENNGEDKPEAGEPEGDETKTTEPEAEAAAAPAPKQRRAARPRVGQ